MLIIPAIDLKGNQVIRLYKGDFNRISHYKIAPEEVFSEYLVAGAKRAHFIFLWGAYSGSISETEETVLKKIIRMRDIYHNNDCKIQVGGGIRTYSKISSLINGGIDYVIIGTSFLIPLAIEEGFTKNDILMFYQHGGKKFEGKKELPEFDLMEKLDNKIKDRVIVSIDYKNDEVALSGWQVTIPLTPYYVMKKLIQKGYHRFILTNVEKDGTLEGVDTNSISKITERVLYENYQPKEIIIAGGVKSEKDIHKLNNLKYKPNGVIVGKALYQSNFNLRKSISLFQNGKNKI